MHKLESNSERQKSLVILELAVLSTTIKVEKEPISLEFRRIKQNSKVINFMKFNSIKRKIYTKKNVS
jgi:hypothetical protein